MNRKLFTTAFYAAFFLVLCVLASPVLAQQADAGRQLTASITKVTGRSVQVSPDNGATWNSPKVGDKLGKDSQIRTGFGSECEVSFADHSVVQVQPLSSLKIADYSGTETKQNVSATVQYGAVRCGVEKGRITPDTQINTPVSTLSIRGTLVYVEYDPGTRRCTLWTVEKGPAMAQSSEGKYELDEGMDTDCSLSRYLERSVWRRHGWIQGSTDAENHGGLYQDGATDPSEGANNNNDDKDRDSQRSSYDGIINGGDVPIGSGQDTPSEHAN